MEDESQEINGTHPAVKQWLRSIQSKGGKSRSERKILASRQNGIKPCKPGKFRGRPKKVKE